MSIRPLLIVDGANVVGSVPDGWWRDRAGAALRLREALAPVPTEGLPGLAGPVQVVLVVEGAARGLSSTEDIEVVSAPRDGDSTIVDLVREAGDRQVAVVTADRALRDQVVALGATVLGPRSVRRS
jgi:hypothetical protein